MTATFLEALNLLPGCAWITCENINSNTVFNDSLNQVCNYGCDVELTPLFFLVYSSSVDRASNTHILNSTTAFKCSSLLYFFIRLFRFYHISGYR